MPKQKNVECQLVFHQRKSPCTVLVCTVHPQTWSKVPFAWVEMDSKDFYSDLQRKKNFLNYPFVYIGVPKTNMTIQEIVANYIQCADPILVHTGVDPKRIGSLKETAMQFFEADVHKSKVPLTRSTQFECRWLHEAHRGGLMHAKPGEYNHVEQFDFTSFYPSICNSDLIFPTGKNKKFYLKTPGPELDLEQPAIYLVKPFKHHPLLKLKPIIKSPDDWIYVTNLDLQSARDLVIDFELAESSKKPFYNCMQWEGIAGHKLFKTYVDRFFSLKKSDDEDSKIAGKVMLNVLTGLLVEKRHDYGSTMQTNQVIDLTHCIIHSITRDTIKTIDPKKLRYFKRPDFAKYGVWITAHGRRRMVKTLLEHQDHLVHVHTDGFVLTSGHKLDRSTYLPGDELGGLKLEYKGPMHVKNVHNKVKVQTC